MDPVMADRLAAAQLRERPTEPNALNTGTRNATSVEATPTLTQGISSGFGSTLTSPDVARTASVPAAAHANANATRQARTLVSLRHLPAGTTWSDEFRLLLGAHCAWEAVPFVPARNRPLRPRQSTCAITGAPALYRDPRNGVPFASAEAYGVLSEVMEGAFAWSADAGASSGAAGGGAQGEEEEMGEALRLGVYTDRIEERGANDALREARLKAGVRREVAPVITTSSSSASPAPLAGGAGGAGPRPSARSIPTSSAASSSHAQQHHASTSQHAHAHAQAAQGAQVQQVAPGWVIAPAFEVAPGDEKAIVAAALALPSGTTRSGGRRSAANVE